MSEKKRASKIKKAKRKAILCFQRGIESTVEEFARECAAGAMKKTFPLGVDPLHECKITAFVVRRSRQALRAGAVRNTRGE